MFFFFVKPPPNHRGSFVCLLCQSHVLLQCCALTPFNSGVFAGEIICKKLRMLCHNVRQINRAAGSQWVFFFFFALQQPDLFFDFVFLQQSSKQF